MTVDISLSDKRLHKIWVVFVVAAQLTEWSIPAPEDLGSNPDIVNII